MMTTRSTRLAVLVCCALQLAFVSPLGAEDQRFQVGAQVAVSQLDEFDTTDTGFGGRVSWFPSALLGLDAELNIYPGNIPDRVPFSRGRWEGFFGATAGPRIGPIRPFAKLRPGFVTYQEAPAPIACILIFPPPLSCELAGGRTMLALDIGGGIESSVGGRAMLRVDAGERMVKYPGPTIGKGLVSRESFFGHDFRFTIGAGVRF